MTPPPQRALAERMHPWLVRTPQLAVPTWAALVAVAAVVLLAALRREALRDEESPRWTVDSAWLVLPAAWIGGRLGDAALGAGSWLDSAASLTGAGSSLYGAGLAGALAATVYARARGGDAWRLLDRYAVATALALPFARLGCVASGCCYGRPATWPLGVELPWGIASDVIGPASAALAGIPLHPTALAEALASAAIAVPLVRARRTGRSGQPALLGTLLYGTVRVGLDTLRHPDARGLLFGAISGSQLVALATAAAALAALAARRRNT
jgi:phosphatidylglycerol:prolipoprotein diacylglycerol transferase